MTNQIANSNKPQIFYKNIELVNMAEIVEAERFGLPHYLVGRISLEAKNENKMQSFKRYSTGESFEIRVLALNPNWPEPLPIDEERLR